LHFGEDGGVGGDGEAVEMEPLEEADPDGDLGESGGVGVDFDVEELDGADAGEELEGVSRFKVGRLLVCLVSGLTGLSYWFDGPPDLVGG
jgi:hypothetical protein